MGRHASGKAVDASRHAGEMHARPRARGGRLGAPSETPTGQAIAYLYSRENEVEARQAKVLTVDEARRMAVNFARLTELLGKAD